MDVVDLFSCILGTIGREYFERTISEFPLEFPEFFMSLEFMDLILNNNYFLFAGDLFRQMMGVSMGTACAPI